MQCDDEIFDVVVAGAGPSGLYAAWLLARTATRSVCVLEALPIIGGRLQSLCGGANVAPIELGAGFVSDAHRLVLHLASELGCELEDVHFADAGAYLRGAAMGESRFALDVSERGKSAGALINDAMLKLAPEVWPGDLPTSAAERTALIERLCDVRVQGRALQHWSMDALMREGMSSEAFALARATHGSTAALGPINAFDAIALHLHEASAQTWRRFKRGFHHFAVSLAHGATRAGAKIKTGQRVLAITRAGDDFKVRSTSPDGATLVLRARRVILALPRAALRAIRFGPDVTLPGFRDALNGVVEIGAVKLAIEFDGPFRSAGAPIGGSGGKVLFNAHFTDLPLQQSYFTSDDATRVLAVFADGAQTPFWRALRCDVSHNSLPIVEAPQAMLAAAMAQLTTIHSVVPNPIRGVFADWPSAWHAWKPHINSAALRERITQPNPDLPLFICGEAFALQQGWTEGALQNAEQAVERALSTEPANRDRRGHTVLN